MQSVRALFLVVLLLTAQPVAVSGTISAISTSNNSSANESTSAGSNIIREFQTLPFQGPVHAGGDVVSFDHQMQWYNGYYVDPVVSGAALTHRRNVNYDLKFTVEDPLNRGYTLEIDSFLRGYSTALWTSGTSSNAVTTTGTTLSGRVDTDTTDGTDTLLNQISALTLNASSGVTANQTTTFSHKFAEDSDSYGAGAFVGTRSFALRFTSVTSGTTNVFLQNNQTGQGSNRFGLANVDSALDPTGQSQPGDLLTNGELGHFVTVKATFEPIPEPASLVLVVVALSGMGFMPREAFSHRPLLANELRKS